MAKGYVIYNPLAGNENQKVEVEKLQALFEEELEFYDMTRITNYSAFIRGMDQEDFLILVGGDGTLNRFVNDTEGIELPQEILYWPGGNGNDFAKDLGMEHPEKPFSVTQYLQDLPAVEVKGKRCRFLNGVGFGIDGYCCQVGDELKKIPGKKVDYTAIAIKGLLRNFRPRDARVTVDGKEYTYKTVWIAPTMYGRYYGGGMNAAPDQDRQNPDGTLSLMMFHGAGRLRTLCVFPQIFKGTHVNHKKMVAVHTGREITVEFDRPTPLQIDGETVRDVTCYTAKAAVKSAKPVHTVIRT